ncbi:MAG: hypothetical protein ACI90C_000931 [Rhodoferax sp.]
MSGKIYKLHAMIFSCFSLSNNRLVSPTVGIDFVALGLLLLLGACHGSVHAQQLDLPSPPMPQLVLPKVSTPTPERKTSSLTNQFTKPDWQDLTPEQKISLKPLTADWKKLGEVQKKKWIAIAREYPALATEEQAKMHARMTEWVSLSQLQRAQARLNFAQTKQLTSTQKNDTWQAYQELSSEEKKKLATSANTKLAGAAAASKPVSPKKLTIVPPKALPHTLINRHTLLPQSAPNP